MIVRIKSGDLEGKVDAVMMMAMFVGLIQRQLLPDR